jgi:hypothetical protein
MKTTHKPNLLVAALSRTATGPAVAAATPHSSLPGKPHHADLLSAFCFLLSAFLFAGCTHMGPKTVGVDRFEYSTAIADSWKQQTLLNIVKLRYMDLPVFVDVASVVSGYSLQTGGSLNGTLSSKNAIQGNFVAAGASAIYTDRPTITYVPMTGEKFLRGLMTPIDPKNIFFMLQSGYAADFVLALTVESLNGVRNRSTAAGAMREADADFLRALELMRGCKPPVRSECAWRRTRRKTPPPFCSSGAMTCPPTSWRRRLKSGGCSSCRPTSKTTCSPTRPCAGRIMSWPSTAVP